MWIYRNKELRIHIRTAFLVLLLTTLAAGIFCRETVLAVFLCGCLWMVLHLLGEYRRYREMRRLSGQVDEILHGDQTMELSHFQEGDLEILRDEIHKMTVRLREQTELLEKEKLTLADALADISHQIRTPLTTLNIIIERMKHPATDDRQRRMLLREAGQMLSKIEWLVNALLKMSKLDAGSVAFHMQDIRMEPFLKEALQPFEIPMEVHGMHCVIQGAENITFTGDYSWTLEAVGNVLKNGMEYTPDGGRLTIVCEENPLYVQLEITDSGSGIPQEDIPHLFERFYRGKNAGNGSFGIGLALSRMILSKENAVIRARNVPGGGGQFQIRFYKTVL